MKVKILVRDVYNKHTSEKLDAELINFVTVAHLVLAVCLYQSGEFKAVPLEDIEGFYGNNGLEHGHGGVVSITDGRFSYGVQGEAASLREGEGGVDKEVPRAGNGGSTGSKRNAGNRKK